MKYRQTHIIINPSAGKSRPAGPVIDKVLKSSGIKYKVMLTKEPGDTSRFAREAVAAQADAVAVYGGDGTVMEAAGVLVHTRVPLLVLRGGTGNIIASELNIPMDLEQAFGLLTGENSTTRLIDAGQMNDRTFLMRVSLGFEAEMVKGARSNLKHKAGSLAYAAAAFKALIGTRPVDYYIELDDKKIKAGGLVCIVANSANLGMPGLALVPGISISDGLLDVIVIRHPMLEALFSLAAYVIDKEPSNAYFLRWQARRIKVTAQPHQDIQFDGEILPYQNIDAQIIPQALKVIVPAV